MLLYALRGVSDSPQLFGCADKQLLGLRVQQVASGTSESVTRENAPVGFDATDLVPACKQASHSTFEMKNASPHTSAAAALWEDSPGVRQPPCLLFVR